MILPSLDWVYLRDFDIFTHMKHFTLILLVVSSLNLYAQIEKDSLLKHDIDEVAARLELMHYLDQSTIYLAEVNDFKIYFEEHISYHNDSLKVKIIDFLNLKKPLENYTFRQYVERVYKTNVDEFIKLITKYGYPSTKRLNRF